jgi:DinB superfamily
MNATTIAALANYPQQLRAHYAAIPGTHKHWAPESWDGVPSEALTAIEQICHVRDIEIEGYQVRIERTLTQINPFLPSIDTDGLAKSRAYGSSNVEEALDTFERARAKTIELIAGLKLEQFDRIAMFEGYGAVSLRSLVHYLCSHDQQHLAGLQWLLGKIEASRLEQL